MLLNACCNRSDHTPKYGQVNNDAGYGGHVPPHIGLRQPE